MNYLALLPALAILAFLFMAFTYARHPFWGWVTGIAGALGYWLYLGYDQDLSKSITVHAKDVQNIYTITITNTERDLIVQALWFMAGEGQANDQEVMALATKLDPTA